MAGFGEIWLKNYIESICRRWQLEADGDFSPNSGAGTNALPRRALELVYPGEAVSQDFRDFVLSIRSTGEPADDALDQLWTELRRRLRLALRRRGLWHRPPSYLGGLGPAAWTLPETADRRGLPTTDQDALDELTTDFYVEMFVKRLPSLRRYAERGDNLEKVISLGAGQLILERQRQSDRLGYRLFQWLRAALLGAVESRDLYVLAGSVKIGNDTVFGFDRRASAEPRIIAGARVDHDALAAVVRRWNDDLVRDWVSARGSAVSALIDRLAGRLPALRRAGIEVFAFKALVDAFKHDVRGRLALLLGDVESASVEQDPLRPRQQRQHMEALSECVEAGIDGGGGQRRTREKLLKVWRFLVDFALYGADPALAGHGHGALTAALERESLPAHRELSRLLGIRHDRFPALMARLRKEAERCLETDERPRRRHRRASGKAADTDNLGPSAAARGGEASLHQTRDLRKKLKRLTAEAFRRETPPAPAVAGPEPGGLYHLEGCPQPGVEWLVVEVEGDGYALVVPADSLLLLGASDLAVADAAAGALSLRCDLGVRLPPEVFRAEDRTALLAAADLEHVRTLCNDQAAYDQAAHDQAAHDQAAGSAAETVGSEIDLDPDYLDWRRSLEAARNAIARVYGGRLIEHLEARHLEAPAAAAIAGNVVPMHRRGFRPSWRSFAVAASITVVAGGLVSYLVGLRSELTDLRAMLEIERRPEAAIPWVLASSGTRRGSAELLVVPAGARSIGLLIDAESGDRIEISDAAGGEVWAATIERVDGLDETLVRIPAALMPPGAYSVKAWRGKALEVDFEVRIELP